MHALLCKTISPPVLLACQLRQLPVTTVIVGTWRHNSPSLQYAKAFLERTLNEERLMLISPGSMDPANFFSDWLELRSEAQCYLKEFARINLSRVYDMTDARHINFTQRDPEPVESHRILRSFLRLQLLHRLSLHGTEVARTFISTLTPWELEESRSVNGFMKIEYQTLLKHTNP